MKLSTAIIFGILIMVGSFMFTNYLVSKKTRPAPPQMYFPGGSLPADADQAATSSNVIVTDGKQVIDLKARGGYSPKLTVAKAGIPTVLRITTNNTFDCSAAIRIPSLNIAQLLPSTGSKEISLGNPEKGTLFGMCGMGMYRFTITFQ